MSGSLKTEEIKKYFVDREEFSSKELYEFYTFYESDLNKNTFRWRVHNLKEIGAIKSSRHGYYYVEKEEEKKNYIVLTADIINSKKNDYRNMKNEIEKNLKDLNGKYKSTLLKGFTISQGDEIQGLLDINEKFPVVLRELRYSVFPCLLRVAIGIGSVEDEEHINDVSKTSWDMNGEAFFRAREGMDSIENEKKTKTKFVGFDIEGIGVDLVSILNNTYDLMDSTIDDWSRKQWDAVQLYHEYGDLKSVVENLQGQNKYTVSAISQRLRSAKAKLVYDSEKVISDYILKFK